MAEEVRERLMHHPVLDDIAAELSHAYVKHLGNLNEEIASVLRRSYGLSKSEGLYVISGGLDLAKAKKPNVVSKQPRKKMSDAEAKKKREEAAVSGKGAGSRGGKWWRDKHGHVRYGKKPESADEEREWEPLPQEEAEKLHASLEAVYGYSSEVRNAMNAVLAKTANMGPDALLHLFRDANSFGVPIDEYWNQLAEDAGVSEEDAHEALSQVTEAYRSALQDPAFKKVAKRAIQRRELEEKQASEQLGRSRKYADGYLKDFMTGNTRETAIRLLGMLADMKFLHIPQNLRESQESFEDKAEAKKKVGSIVPNKNRMRAVFNRLDELTPEQQVAAFITQRFRDLNEADADSKGALAFKEDDGSWSSTILTEGAEGEGEDENEKINSYLNGLLEQTLEEMHGSDLSDSAKEKYQKRLNEVAFHVNELVEAFNHDHGGQELGLIFHKTYPTQKLFEEKDAVATLEKSVREKQQLVESALKAQTDANFDEPEAIKKGGQRLFDYQKQAVNWMKTVKRGLLAYFAGAGKTPISISMVAHLRELAAQGKISKEDARGIIVMPKGVVKQWPKEIRRFFPDAKIVSIGDGIGSLEDRIKVLDAIQRGDVEADFVIMSASTVAFSKETREAHKANELFDIDEETGKATPKKGVSEEEITEALREAASGDQLCNALRNLKGCVFMDEAHSAQQGLKTATNIHNAAAREFLKDRERGFLLTATPMPNGDPKELFELMDVIHPGSAGPDARRFESKAATYAHEVNQKTGKLEMKVAGFDDWKTLSSDVAPYVFRKRDSDKDVIESREKAGIKMPPLKSDTHVLKMHPTVAALMDMAGEHKPHDYDEKQLKRKEGERKPFTPASEEENHLVATGQKIRQMIQLSITPKLLLGDSYKGPQPKLEHMADMVLKHFDEPNNHDKPMVIFSSYPSAFKYAREELVKRGVHTSLISEIHGEVSAKERDAIQEATNAGKTKVLFVGIESGGFGLNLQKKANEMMFLDQPWSPGSKEQAIGRVWRTGQENEVKVNNLQLNNSIDETKMAGLAKKIATDTAVGSSMGGEAAMQQVLTGSLIKMLGGTDSMTNLSDHEIDAKLDKLGLKGLVPPKALKEEFKMDAFRNSVGHKDFVEFGQEYIATDHLLNDVHLKDGDINKEQHAATRKRLDREERDWSTAAKLMGKQPIALPKKPMTPEEPEAQYVMTEAKGAKLSELSDHAKAVLATMKKTKGGMSISDFTDTHLKEEMEKEIERDKQGNPKDPAAHAISSKKFFDSRKDIKKLVEGGFKELQRNGLISIHGGNSAGPDTPLPPPPAKATASASKKVASAPAAKPAPAAKMKTSGLKYNFKKMKEHAGDKEYKKAKVGPYPFATMMEVLQESKKAPTSHADLKEFFGTNDKQTEQFIQLMHEWEMAS